MKELVLLIKPASDRCNMLCRYCFYKDEFSALHKAENPSLMSLNTMELIVKKAFESSEKKCTFVFQGGEPTLCGIEFFRYFEELIDRYNVNNIEVDRFFQTNGYALNEEYAELFLKYSYCVGVSIDGREEQHCKYRISKDKEAYKKIVTNFKMLLDYGVDVCALVTITDNNAVKGKELYRYLRSLGAYKLQFTKCINNSFGISLSPDTYGEFLKDVFSEYIADLMNGKKVSVREFDNFILLFAGKRCETCGFDGVCRGSLTIEANGSVYPCDFYVSDETKIGDIQNYSFDELSLSDGFKSFLCASRLTNEECTLCEYFRLCGGGCRRYRNENGRYIFCESYKTFFKYALPYLRYISTNLK